MKRVDDRKVSLVEFLRSIKFSRPRKIDEKTRGVHALRTARSQGAPRSARLL